MPSCRAHTTAALRRKKLKLSQLTKHFFAPTRWSHHVGWSSVRSARPARSGRVATEPQTDPGATAVLRRVWRARLYGRQQYVWSATAKLDTARTRGVGAQQGSKSNPAASMRPKALTVVPITCAGSRFSCISAWQGRCMRIGARTWLQWAASLVCVHTARRICGFTGHRRVTVA